MSSFIKTVVIYVNKARESAAQQEAAAVVDIYEVYLTEEAAGLLKDKTDNPAAGNGYGLESNAAGYIAEYDFFDYYYEITEKVLDAEYVVENEEFNTSKLNFAASNGKTVVIDLSQYQANAGN